MSEVRILSPGPIPERKYMSTLRVHGKVSDMGTYNIADDDGNVTEYEGYVPYNLCIGGGDYIDLTIDIDTGQVLNWDPEKVKATLKSGY